jgi:site-specific DNA recombinase
VNNAVLESRKISERVKRKHRARAQAGLTNGGSRRYGYERDGMTVRESEAAIVRECVERSIDGEVTWRIARDLNERGVPTAYGPWWRTENLQRLILSKWVVGIREHHGAEYPAQWLPMITIEDQERVRLVWKSRQQGPDARPRGQDLPSYSNRFLRHL